MCEVGGNRGVVKALSTLFFRRLGASGLHGSLCDEAGITACVEDFGALRHNDIHGHPEHDHAGQLGAGTWRAAPCTPRPWSGSCAGRACPW